MVYTNYETNKDHGFILWIYLIRTWYSIQYIGEVEESESAEDLGIFFRSQCSGAGLDLIGLS